MVCVFLLAPTYLSLMNVFFEHFSVDSKIMAKHRVLVYPHVPRLQPHNLSCDQHPAQVGRLLQYLH